MKGMLLATEHCEFCDEVNGRPSRFKRYYAQLIPSRVLIERAGFIVMPSMGQVVSGSLMMLPRQHVERFSDFDDDTKVRAEQMIGTIARAAGPSVAVFEHGARSRTGGACGIYHAHVHIVPLPKNLRHQDLARGLTETPNRLSEAWKRLAQANEYLLLSDGFSRSWTRDVAPSERADFPSQHFRRVLASACACPDRWDWRQTSQPEGYLLETREKWLRITDGGAFDVSLEC